MIPSPRPATEPDHSTDTETDNGVASGHEGGHAGAGARRGLLVAAVGSALTGLSVAVAAPAEAAAPTTRTLDLYRVLTYRYDPARRRTTVTRARRERVVVRVSGRSYLQRDGSGAWVRIPYVWSAAKRGLVYDRYLHLQLQAAARTPRPRPPGPPSGNVYLSADQDRHLLRRAAFGPNQQDLADLARLGRAAWLRRQLAPATIDDTACEAVISARFPHLDRPIWQVNDLLETGEYSSWQQQVDICGAHIARALWSRRRLLAAMEDFWSDHFNVTCPSDGVPAARADYARVLRQGALGRFADLLVAVIEHPSMLVYLNNNTSSHQHPNENLGRELLELHTVGLDAGYTEDDVLDSARILTGLSVSWESAEFAYKPWKHWVGQVRVLDFTDPNPTRTGGREVARRYLAHLARHPQTARTVATKLARRFVADEPPELLVDRLATVYLAQDTAIAPVLLALFESAEFAASIGQKVRRPFEHLIATARLLELTAQAGTGTDGIFWLYWMSNEAGHTPLGWPLPDGYPDRAGPWTTTATTLARWNSTVALVAGWGGEDLARPPLRRLFLGDALPADHGALVDAVARRLLGRDLLPAHRSALLELLEVSSEQPVHAGSAAVNWRMPYWVAAILDTPYHLYR